MPRYVEPVFRPPSETRSLIFQVTVGCSRNSCTFCGMCVESCNYDALRMSSEFELADTTRTRYELVLNHKEGRN